MQQIIGAALGRNNPPDDIGKTRLTLTVVSGKTARRDDVGRDNDKETEWRHIAVMCRSSRRAVP